MLNIKTFKKALILIYIVMFLISFIGIQVYRKSQVLGDNLLDSENEVSAEVELVKLGNKEVIEEGILIENNFFSQTQGLISEDIEVSSVGFNVVSLVKTNIVKKEIIVPKEVIVTKINSDIGLEVIGSFTVSGFCGCKICNENKVSKEIMSNYKGVNVATNSDEIPYGIKIWIEGIGIRQTQPSGQKLVKNEIKIYFSTHEEVENFGKQILDIYKVSE